MGFNLSRLHDMSSFPSDRLLDVDKIKELAALIIKCDVDGSRDLINPLFELVSDLVWWRQSL